MSSLHTQVTPPLITSSRPHSITIPRHSALDRTPLVQSPRRHHVECSCTLAVIQPVDSPHPLPAGVLVPSRTRVWESELLWFTVCCRKRASVLRAGDRTRLQG